MSLADDLRECADAKVSAFTPHWRDTANRLMRQAADALDAANVALAEYHRAANTTPAPHEHCECSDLACTKWHKVVRT